LWPFVVEAEGEEEHFEDVPIEEETVQAKEEHDEDADDLQEEKFKDSEKVLYLPTTRNPLYCKAEHSCLWELAMVGLVKYFVLFKSFFYSWHSTIILQYEPLQQR